MLAQLLLAALLTVATVAIHAGCTVGILRFLAAVYVKHPLKDSVTGRLLIVSMLVLALLFVTLLEAILWSLTYLQLGVLDDAREAVYFSIVTFTTLGYGDVVPQPGWRVLAALQAAVGIIVFGWTTALIFSVLQLIGAAAPARER